MGALTVTSVSTFTSCKDYDSDISNLQGQIDKAALSTDVQSLKTQVEAAASSASSAATTAEKALSSVDGIYDELDELEDYVNKNAEKLAYSVDSLATVSQATEDKVAKLQEANQKAAKDAADAIAQAKDLDTKLTAAIEQWGLSKDGYYTATQIDAKLDSIADAIANATDDSIASLKKVVDGYKTGINALYSAVTEVTIVTTEEYSSDLTFQSGVINVEDYTFGAKEVDDKNAEHSATPTYDYKKGNTFSFPTEVLVRVNPVNAKIDASMIKLIDSKGGDLSNLLEVASVEKFDEYLTKTRASETGLWLVSLKTKDGVKSEDLAATQVDGKNKLYALAINNTAAQAETAADAASRYVVSGYDLTVAADSHEYQGENSLDEVLLWAASKKSDKQLLSDTKNSARDTKPAITAQNGENIVVSFENLPEVDRFYVVRDDAHAGDGEESQTSEINAWNSYDIKGIGEVIEVKNGYGKGTLNIKINGEVGDEVQFRIFAVNYNGTLVESKGRAFRVYVGAKTTSALVVGKLVGTSTKGEMSTGWIPVEGTLTDDATILENNTVTLLVDGKEFTAAVEYAQDAAGKTRATKGSEVKYIKLTVSDNLTEWANGEAAVGTIEDSNKPVKNSIGISLTKVLPTAETAKDLVSYTWKDNQKVNGVYTAYLYPENDQWYTTVANGYKNMNQAITGLDANCIIEVENAQWKDNGNTQYFSDPLIATTSPWTLTAFNRSDSDNKPLIDGETEHKSYIKYNFGKINSEKPNEDYTVIVEEYSTVFACPLTTTAQHYSWKQIPATKTTPLKNVNELTYGSTNTVDGVKLLDYIIGKNDFDNTVFGGALSSLYKGALNSGSKYQQIEGKLISNGSKKEDYFKVVKVNGDGTITFEVNSDATNPSADVASTLVLTMQDAFGHKNVYELPFTVKRAE